MNYALDDWDHQLIQLCKKESFPTEMDLRNFWAERCGIDVHNVNTVVILGHMLSIIDVFKLKTLIQFGQSILDIERSRHEENLTIVETMLRFAINALRLASIYKIPTYRRWLNSKENHDSS